VTNTVYGGRADLGNGPYSSGDGFRYHGRGLIQLTDRANYTAAALALREPYIDKPELVAEPADACLTAGWFWNRGRCNSLADASDIDGITRVVNGPGMAMVHAGQDVVHAVRDDGKGKPIRDIADAVGMGLHIPGMGQAGVTAQYLQDVHSGKAQPANAAEYAKGLVTGHGTKH
jgi:hypothetical protein